ncbi:MAG: ribbon-helix-helix domain-containing protein [Hyphomicrobiaceae bacterium]
MHPVKRSFTIKKHRTSISLEAPFWEALKAAAADSGVSLAGLVSAIDANRGTAGLSSAVRVWALDFYRRRAVVDIVDKMDMMDPMDNRRQP